MDDLHDVYTLANSLGVRLEFAEKRQPNHTWRKWIVAKPKSAITPELVQAIQSNRESLLRELEMVYRMVGIRTGASVPCFNDWKARWKQ